MSDMHITGWKKKHLIAKHLQILAYIILNKSSKQDKEENLNIWTTLTSLFTI